MMSDIDWYRADQGPTGRMGRPRVTSEVAAAGGGRVAIYYQIIRVRSHQDQRLFGGLGNGGLPNGASGLFICRACGESGRTYMIITISMSVSLTTPIPNPSSGSIALTHMRVGAKAMCG